MYVRAPGALQQFPVKHYRTRMTLFIDPCASRGMSSGSLDHASLPSILKQAPRVHHRPGLQ